MTLLVLWRLNVNARHEGEWSGQAYVGLDGSPHRPRGAVMFYAIVTRHKASGGEWTLWMHAVYETEAHAALGPAEQENNTDAANPEGTR